MASAQFTASGLMNQMGTRTETNRWFHGTPSGIDTSSYSYHVHTRKTVIKFDGTAIWNSIGGKDITAIKLTLRTSGASDYVSATIFPWVTAWTSVPGSVSSSFDNLSPGGTNNYWTTRLSSFNAGSYAGDFTGTIATGSAAQSLYSALTSGYCIGLLDTTFTPGQSLYSGSLNNWNAGPTNYMPVLTIEYNDYTSFNPPSSVTVSPASVAPGGSARVSWSGVSGGNALSVSKYEVYRSSTSASSGFALLSSTTNSYLDVTGNTTANGSYWYKVKVIANVSGYDSSLSSATAQLQSPVVAPTPPTSVFFDSTATIAPGATRLLKWTGAAGGTNNDISKYSVYRATSANGSYSTHIGDTTSTSMNVTSPSLNNTSYYYKVLVVGAAGINSALSSSYATLTTSFSAPSTPTGLALSSNNIAPSATSTLTWNASSNGTNNTVSGYLIERAEGSTGPWSTLVASQTERSLDVTGRSANGQSYFYRVTALAPLGNSAVSATIELKTVVGTIAAPTNVKVNGATSSTVSPGFSTSVTWTASANATNNSVTGYAIYSSLNNAAYTLVGEVASSVTELAVAAPSTEATISYHVIAKGSRVNSAASSAATMTVSLDTADAAAFTVSPTSVYAGSDVTINITSNVDKIKKFTITFGSVNSGEITIAADADSGSYTIPLSWCQQIPNALSGSASIKVDTYVGSTLVGRKTGSLYINVPTAVVPTLASFSAERVNNSVPAAWGIYVVSKSQVKLTMGQGAGAQGSTITNYRLTGGGMNVSNTTPITQTSPVLTATSTTYTATVTDSRGRTSSYNVTINASSYAAPTLATVSFRCLSTGVEAPTDGTYGSAKATSTFSSLGGNNSITITAGYRVKGSTGAYTNIGTLTSGTAKVFGSGGLQLTQYYEVKYTVTDLVGTTVTYVGEISSAQYLLHFRNTGRGLGIGGAAMADNQLDVHWKTMFRGDIDVLGQLLKNGQPLDLTGDYLPLSGGTLTGLLRVKNTGTHNTIVQNSNTEGEFLFGGSDTDSGDISDYIRVGREKLQYKTNSGTYSILHSGNYTSYVTPAGIGAAASSHGHSYGDINILNYDGTSMNNNKTTGFSRGYNMTNAAVTQISSFETIVYSPDWITQIQHTIGATPQMHIRSLYSGTTWGSWYKFLHSGNYTDYTVTKTGTGASGDWPINITGEVKTSGTYNTFRTGYGYVQIGPANANWAHFNTDRPSFYFSKQIAVTGEIMAGASYNQRVYHRGNITFSTTVPTSLPDGDICFVY